MNLRQLEAFRATMDAGSITGAAAILNISQPSVSRLVSDLEISVGFPLFLRVGRGLVSTVEARRFHLAVNSMFLGVDRLRDLAETIRTTAGGVVSLGVIPAFSHMIVPESVQELYDKRLDVRIMVSMHNTPAIVDAVRMQQFDVGLVGRAAPYAGVEILHQTHVSYVCLLPSGHRLAKNQNEAHSSFDGHAELDLEELVQTDEFVTFGGVFPDDMLDIDEALSARMQKNSRLSATNMPVAAALVRQTGALAIVDPFTAEVAKAMGGVISRAIKQRLKYNIAVITRGMDTLSLEARDLADIIIDKLEQSGKG